MIIPRDSGGAHTHTHPQTPPPPHTHTRFMGLCMHSCICVCSCVCAVGTSSVFMGRAQTLICTLCPPTELTSLCGHVCSTIPVHRAPRFPHYPQHPHPPLPPHTPTVPSCSQCAAQMTLTVPRLCSANANRPGNPVKHREEEQKS